MVAFGTAYADTGAVRVLSFAQGKEDTTGQAVTRGVQEGFSAKGFAKPGEAPEPAFLQELKSRNLVQGVSLDEVKGIQVGAGYLVTGTYSVAGDKISVVARLVEVESGSVVAAVTEDGSASEAEAVGKQAGQKLAGSIAKPADAGKVETIDIEAVGMAPGNLPGSAARTVALADAKRNAIEGAIGAVVNVAKVPDLKQVKQTAQSVLRYRVLKEGKEGGRYVVRIAANVDFPAELAAKYPAPAKLISDETGFKPYIERSEKGEVDWAAGVLRVVGRAKKPAGADAKAELNARRAAVADAYARALEVVSGVRLDSDAAVSDAEKKDKSLRVRIEGLVQGGKVVNDNPNGAQGNYEVTLEVPMRGLRGVQTAFLDQFNAPQKGQFTEAAAVDFEAGEFTGIVIDARGTGLQAGMFPKLMDEEGNVIADPAATNAEILKQKGQAAYVVGNPAGDQGFLEERLGPRPLFFKAELDGSYEVASLVPMAPMVVGQAQKVDFSKFAARRQGPKPLQVKGLKSGGQTKVNMLVSTNHKNKAQFKKNLAKAFGDCRVVVIMDSQIGGTEGRLQPGEFKLIELSLR
jgi:TolB-like protein